ncbi:MAG: hypothetical protein P4L31_01750 [Candidatus Babeliales bacterium]|nr:hypothetical protein [Candidatus Babeliales bacterium]
MAHPIILIILILLMQQSCGSAPSTNSITDICPTDLHHPSSYMIRQRAFEILKRSGYPNPHEITIANVNSPSSTTAPNGHTAGANISLKKIFFNETHYKECSIGYKLATIGHEAMHIRLNHTTLMQDQERLADTESLLLGACEQCGVEVAQHYALEQQKQQKNKLDIFGHPDIPETIQEFSLKSHEEKREFIALAKLASAIHYTTHPCDLERAFYLYELSQSPTLKGKICRVHHEIQQILQEAQQKKDKLGCSIC